MRIGKGENEIKISRWEVSIIVGGITGAICSICNVINRARNKREKEQEQ